jgi:hypothetical protein
VPTNALSDTFADMTSMSSFAVSNFALSFSALLSSALAAFPHAEKAH